MGVAGGGQVLCWSQEGAREEGGSRYVMQERSTCSRLDVQMAVAFLQKWVLNWLIVRDWM